MKIIRLSDGTSVSSVPSSVSALGSFDGVHAGHAALLSEVRARAERDGLSSVVWMLRGKEGTAALLSGEDERAKLFSEAGIEYLATEDFEKIRDLSPEEFVKSTLIERLGCRAAVCGYNFRFGRCASADASDLDGLMRMHGAQASVVAPVVFGGEPISSTRIRDAIGSGDVSSAAAMLGRPYALSGRVAHGRALGRKLGFPTANLIHEDGRAVPARGVYLTRCTVDGRRYSAVTSVGGNPTVCDGEKTVIECHIIDFSEDIYDRDITVRFYDRLRGERRFEGVDELVLAVKENIAQCREWDKRIKESGENALI